MKSLYIVAAVILLGALSQPSMAQAKVIELGHETSPAMIHMPDRADGELTLQRCDTCIAVRLRASAATLYILGNERVTLTEMTRYLELNPGTVLVVMQAKDTSVLTRVVVHSANRAQ